MNSTMLTLAAHHGAAIDHALDQLAIAIGELKADYIGMANVLAPKHPTALRIARCDQAELALALAHGLQRAVNALDNPTTKDFVRLNVDTMPVASVTQILRAGADTFNALEGYLQ